MTATLRSFALGVMAVLPALPVAWVLGGRERTSNRPPDDSCACSHQIEAMRELLDEVALALRRQGTVSVPSVDAPVPTISSEVGTIPPFANADIVALVRSAVLEAFGTYWAVSVDDADGLRDAVAKAGRTPFDPGVMDLILETRRLLAEEADRFATDAADIKARFPLVMQHFNAAEEGRGIPMSHDQQRAYLEEFSDYAKENNPRAAQHEKDRKAILKDFADALLTR
jgi:hypothetical protein